MNRQDVTICQFCWLSLCECAYIDIIEGWWYDLSDNLICLPRSKEPLLAPTKNNTIKNPTSISPSSTPNKYNSLRLSRSKPPKMWNKLHPSSKPIGTKLRNLSNSRDKISKRDKNNIKMRRFIHSKKIWLKSKLCWAMYSDRWVSYNNLTKR